MNLLVSCVDKEKNGGKDPKKDVMVSRQEGFLKRVKRVKKIQPQMCGVVTVRMTPIEAKMAYVLVKKHVKHVAAMKFLKLVVPHLVGSTHAKTQKYLG